jgi:membrane-bound lytic murein transglycosylase D
MDRISSHPYLRRLALALLCAPLPLLAGCPGGAMPAASTPAAAKAPTLAANPAAAQTARPASSAVPPIDAALAQRKAQQLIDRVDKSYRSGVENYRANRLDAARLDFDFAVDMMLTSGQDLKTDPTLSDAFERLVDAINSLELAALKQGNGLSPKLEAAPLDAANDITFPANPELTARLKTELNVTSDLPLVINDQVAGYIAYFSNSPSFHAHLARSLERAGKYKDMIQRILAEEGVPQDLIYLAVAESGFQPQALNARSGAGGMWQFMPTGAYGLARNGYYDERFDPEKSSRAYARYIKSLYNQFGDWYLAMAAYDWGPGNIQKAVQRTGYADFWELYRRNVMPAETKAYVPQILAAVLMAKNPDKYNLTDIVPDKPLLSDTVSIGYAIDIRLVADVTGATLPEIAALNPSLLRLSTPPGQAFDLHLPPGTKTLFQERLKDIPEARRISWRFHVVRAGETVEGLAAALHARVADITSTNGISSSDPMSPGDELVVPVQSVTNAAGPQHYTVRRGDTLVTVADRFNVSVEDLRRWNKLTASAIVPGRSLSVAEPVHLGPATRVRARTRSSTKKTAASSSHGAASAKTKTKSANAAAGKASAHTATKPKTSSTKPKDN